MKLIKMRLSGLLKGCRVMKHYLMLAITGLFSIGLISSMSVAQESKGAVQSQYELTKSCKKGYVKNKKRKCVKLVCSKKQYLNAAKTKCLPTRSIEANSY